MWKLSALLMGVTAILGFVSLGLGMFVLGIPPPLLPAKTPHTQGNCAAVGANQEKNGACLREAGTSTGQCAGQDPLDS